MKLKLREKIGLGILATLGLAILSLAVWMAVYGAMQGNWAGVGVFGVWGLGFLLVWLLRE